MSGSNSDLDEQTNSADTGFPPDLLLALDRTSRDGLAVQLQHQLRSGIQQGRLMAGSLLPPSRVLAAQLGVARSVVVAAYEHLVADGYLTGHQGSGTRVRTVAPQPPPRTHHVRNPAVPLGGGLPDPALFPRTEWLRHYRNALTAAPNSQLGYPGPLGTRPLREALTEYLARIRGVVATPDHTIVTSGLTQGITLLARALRARGCNAIAVEDPCFGFHRDAIARTGLRVTQVPVDENGLDVARLAELDVGAVLVAPAHSYPTGVVLDTDRRAALISWARHRDALIIEDDYDAEFRYDRSPIGALQGLAPEHVAYAGCVSKTLSPALRIGWIVLPPWLVEPVAAEKLYDDMGNSVFEQLALSRFIGTGGLTRHLRRVRSVYRRRRDVMLGAISASMPQTQPTGIDAGLHVYLRLPTGSDEDAIVAAAREQGLRLDGARWNWADPDSAPPALVIGYGALSETAIRDSVSRLAPILARLGGRQTR
ncbi:MocR-like pyridoxine biosynthesis transcription factor PdxR [Mycolicibacterium lutetiense]|uniref:GntR family transcriptional regulator/MocR family aminotransferase n=1 Tax=Mycolicibacterium lutetiense TaxID=1641992 RepID=A0ABS4ZWN0_9MYCO|nr:PLP-dependent aminotransferase family protein [Mycolicibacterium lutetiense]MBP2453888.1 GntR family transcriptional regulator/MocR family aminotransferase [Mycolicibacterium lutetiense]